MNPQALQAVLFDLDGTLLHNDMEQFLPPYFRLAAARFQHILPADVFISHLIAATQAMIQDESEESNRDVFRRTFPPLLDRPWPEIEAIFLDFYEEDFPKLRRYTRVNPAAGAVVRTAFELGLKVVVATNPLFPLTAIKQRLDWGGVGDFPYDLVTSYEYSRACKPSLRYFRQILDEIGCPAGAALVVGDENNDMVAAHLGCRTFLVPGPATQLQPGTPAPTYQGDLAAVAPLLQRLCDPVRAA